MQPTVSSPVIQRGNTPFAFPRDLFLSFIKDHQGYFPVRIEALPEGTVAHPSHSDLSDLRPSSIRPPRHLPRDDADSLLVRDDSGHSIKEDQGRHTGGIRVDSG